MAIITDGKGQEWIVDDKYEPTNYIRVDSITRIQSGLAGHYAEIWHTGSTESCEYKGDLNELLNELGFCE